MTRLILTPRAKTVKIINNDIKRNITFFPSMEYGGQGGFIFMAATEPIREKHQLQALAEYFLERGQKGVVTYNGAQYPGKHEPIVDESL